MPTTLQKTDNLNRLERLDENLIPNSDAEIRLFAKVRNEAERLPYFLKYYRQVGINRFFVIDNCSSDNTINILKENSDCHVFLTDQNMSASRAGMDWIEPLLDLYGENRWCLIVDADELLVYPNSEKLLLAEFCQKLERANANAMPCIMIDMYPEGNIENVIYREGQPFEDASPFFDKSGYRFLPSDAANPPQIPSIIGGPRLRMFYPELLDRRIAARARRRVISLINRIPQFDKLPISSKLRSLSPPILNKIPLVRWNKDMSFHSAAHFLRGLGVRISSASGALLHFKFLGDFNRRTHEETVRKAYYRGGEEYKRYLDRVGRDAEIDFICELSTKYSGTDQLLELGLIKEMES